MTPKTNFYLLQFACVVLAVMFGYHHQDAYSIFMIIMALGLGWFMQDIIRHFKQAEPEDKSP